MNKILLVLPVLSGLVGAWIVGGIEDFFTDKLETIPNQLDCDNIKSEEWAELCEETKDATKTSLSIFHIIGFMAGFGSVVGALAKLGIE